jgi:plastocyanin
LASLALLAACGTSTTSATGGNSSSTVEMGSFSFTSGTSITIKAGQAVTFDDPSTGGGTHVLVTGTQGQFSAQAGAPSEFSSANGIMFNPGDSKTITFPTAGTFTITCTIHTSMLATITVTS